MKSWFQDNDVEMYSTHNERKPKYNNTYHTKIKTEPANVKSSTYIDFGVENNDKHHKFKVGDLVRISKHENIFAKGYNTNWSEEDFMIKKVKNTVPWTCGITDLWITDVWNIL